MAVGYFFKYQNIQQNLKCNFMLVQCIVVKENKKQKQVSDINEAK